MDKVITQVLRDQGSICIDKWSIKEGIVFYCGHVYVPWDSQLCHDIVCTHHDTTLVGHLGHWKTLELVSQSYWWPGFSHYIAKYISSCDTCHHVKTFPVLKMGKLMPNKVPTCHWQVVSVNLITELPISRGYDMIMVVVDRLSKQKHPAPTTIRLS